MLEENYSQKTNRKYRWSLASMVCLIASILISIFVLFIIPLIPFNIPEERIFSIGFISLILSIIFGAIGLKKNEGKILSSIGIILSLLIIGFYFISASRPHPSPKNTYIKADMGSMRSIIVMYFDENKSYKGLNNSVEILIIKDEIIKRGGRNFSINIASDGMVFCVTVLLPNGLNYCIDGTMSPLESKNQKCSSNYYACE